MEPNSLVVLFVCVLFHKYLWIVHRNMWKRFQTYLLIGSIYIIGIFEIKIWRFFKLLFRKSLIFGIKSARGEKNPRHLLTSVFILFSQKKSDSKNLVICIHCLYLDGFFFTEYLNNCKGHEIRIYYFFLKNEISEKMQSLFYKIFPQVLENIFGKNSPRGDRIFLEQIESFWIH